MTRPARSAPRLLALTSALLVGGVAGCGGDDLPEGAGYPDVYYPQRLTDQAPEMYRVHFETTAGDFVIQVRRAWAPLGADRFYNLVANGFYDDTRVFRVVPGFMAQFGVAGDPALEYQWRNSAIPDDPVRTSNTRGRVTFAMAGRDSRVNQVFVNLVDNPDLDARGFAPIGEVVEGMASVDAFYGEYGDGPPVGSGPYQRQVLARGNAYLDAEFPELTRILRARVLDSGGLEATPR